MEGTTTTSLGEFLLPIDRGIPKSDLVKAAERRSLADDARVLDAVTELGRAATAFGEQAATLARACDGLVSAIKLARDSAEEEEKEEEEENAQPRGWAGRIKASWAKWRESRGMKKGDVEAPVASNPRSSQQGAPGGDLPGSSQVQDKLSDMHAGVLFGSLALLPYLGPDGLLKSTTFNDGYRQKVCRVFSWSWVMVGLGMSCCSARARLLRLYARVSSHIGMLGITVFVIFFCHWLLDPTGATPWSLIITAVLLHVFVFLWSSSQGDL